MAKPPRDIRKTDNLLATRRDEGKQAPSREPELTAPLANEDLFRSCFNRGLIGIAIVSPDKRWIEANPRLCDLLGYSREELLRTTWAQLTHPDDVEPNSENFDRVLAGEIDDYQLEKRYLRTVGVLAQAAHRTAGN